MYTGFMSAIKKADGFQNEYLYVLPDEFRSKISKNELFNFLTVTDIGYFPMAQYHFRQRPQGCDTAILIYCSTGTGFYSIDGGDTLPLSGGQFIIIPPNTPHIYGASDENPWSVYWVHAKGAFFQPVYTMLSRHLPLKISDIMWEELRGLFRRCFTLLKTPCSMAEYFYLCQLAGTIVALTVCAEKEPGIHFAAKNNQYLKNALKFMEEHIHESISLKDITAAVNLSSSRLHDIFHQSTGYSPVDYFLRSKIQAASRDLYFSTIPIKDIAAVYGIEDPYYFSRLFKKVMGVSPVKYRSQIKG
jgi:AraC-like DNA-binding protein